VYYAVSEMTMRKCWAGFVFAACLAATPFGALAAENFVPLGLGYSPERQALPPLNSWQDRVVGQADLYESEIYRVQRERKLIESQMQRHIDHDLSAEPVLTPDY
jgi:hypothetical protein